MGDPRHLIPNQVCVLCLEKLYPGSVPPTSGKGFVWTGEGVYHKSCYTQRVIDRGFWYFTADTKVYVYSRSRDRFLDSLQGWIHTSMDDAEPQELRLVLAYMKGVNVCYDYDICIIPCDLWRLIRPRAPETPRV